MLTKLRYQLGTLAGRPRRERFLDGLPKGGVGAELGVFRGEFTGHLLRRAKPSELHLVDPWWTVYGERFPNWGAYTDGGRLTTRAAYEEALAVVERAGATDITQVHVGDDLEFLAGSADGTFDWVYVDSTHEYEHTVRELELLKDKVRPGGVIAGDDWHDDPDHIHAGVARAVREFCDQSDWRVVARDDFAQWMIRQDAGPIHE